jgi:hypothetical protein
MTIRMGKILLKKIGHYPILCRPSHPVILNQIQEGLLMGPADRRAGRGMHVAERAFALAAPFP